MKDKLSLTLFTIFQGAAILLPGNNGADLFYWESLPNDRFWPESDRSGRPLSGCDELKLSSAVTSPGHRRPQ
jgi:hypothetical protein